MIFYTDDVLLRRYSISTIFFHDDIDFLSRRYSASKIFYLDDILPQRYSTSTPIWTILYLDDTLSKRSLPVSYCIDVDAYNDVNISNFFLPFFMFHFFLFNKEAILAKEISKAFEFLVFQSRMRLKKRRYYCFNERVSNLAVNLSRGLRRSSK